MARAAVKASSRSASVDATPVGRSGSMSTSSQRRSRMSRADVAVSLRGSMRSPCSRDMTARTQGLRVTYTLPLPSQARTASAMRVGSSK